jgi:hypothetical protein
VKGGPGWGSLIYFRDHAAHKTNFGMHFLPLKCTETEPCKQADFMKQLEALAPGVCDQSLFKYAVSPGTKTAKGPMKWLFTPIPIGGDEIVFSVQKPEPVKLAVDDAALDHAGMHSEGDMVAVQ